MFTSIMAQIDQAARSCCRFLINTYRYCVSPLLLPRCRFWPTCSSYAVQVLQQKALLPALALIFKRMLKCHPWHPGGCDLPPRQLPKETPHV